MEEKYRPSKFWLGDSQHLTAQQRYSERFDAHLYNVATARKSSVYANALIDDALAICGSPYYKLSDRRYSAEALTFLQLFV